MPCLFSKCVQLDSARRRSGSARPRGPAPEWEGRGWRWRAPDVTPIIVHWALPRPLPPAPPLAGVATERAAPNLSVAGCGGGRSSEGRDAVGPWGRCSRLCASDPLGGPGVCSRAQANSARGWSCVSVLFSRTRGERGGMNETHRLGIGGLAARLERDRRVSLAFANISWSC